MRLLRRFAVAAIFTVLSAAAAYGQGAKISEESRTIATYPFSEPNPIPILTRDTRLYPYHSFEGYALKSTPKQWKVVKLENDLIEVFVLPEVGGKVWGAVVKKSGHEFIYRNEVLKFRNIALRGPWTSGGIEFNFGVIGHTPSTATPVDYVLQKNADGSVSCIVGMMDLPSRTQWRVEIRLSADKGAFETNVLWYNPTTSVQPYYNWMTASAPARNDLLMTIPGDAYLGHPGNWAKWPTDPEGRLLPQYSANTFGGNKSYHVVGKVAEFFGGYFKDHDYGFGHWAPHDEMPGQKLWLWALSRAGGIWEDLLTDSDGQYVEYQAGRELVQYTPNGSINPISQVGFEAGATDRWSETWFPLEGTGGLSAASRSGAIYSRIENGHLKVTVMSFGSAEDTLRVSDRTGMLLEIPVSLSPLVPVTHQLAFTADQDYRVQLQALGVDYSSDKAAGELSRPWQSDSLKQLREIPEAQRLATAATQLALGRHYPEARALDEQVLKMEPWQREALLGMAKLDYRRGLYSEGLGFARRLLELDGYDPAANFAAANLYRAMGQTTDAVDGYGWAARSLEFRSSANTQLAEINLRNNNLVAATRYAQTALDYDRFSLPAREILALIARKTGKAGQVAQLDREMLAIDPLHHFVLAENFLAQPDSNNANRLRGRLSGEYPDQTLLELAIDYSRRGFPDDGVRLLALSNSPMSTTWRAWLGNNPGLLPESAALELTFPYRPETLPVLDWAANQKAHWSWKYLLALNLWAVDRPEESADIMASLTNIDFAPALVARAQLLNQVRGQDPEVDLRRAVSMDPGSRIVMIELIAHLQDRERWNDALQVSMIGLERFPTDFNTALLHATSLVNLGRANDALAILDRTNVLPSEHARESHHLYQQAHTIAALDAIDSRDFQSASEHLTAALDWPENLGQGRPYQPEERLVHYLRGVVAKMKGDTTAANREWRAVIDASNGGTNDRLNLLAKMAAAQLGDAEPLQLPVKGPTDLDGQLIIKAWETTP